MTAECARTHPSRKNQYAARVGHPKFHPPWVGEAGGELKWKLPMKVITGGAA